MNELVRWTFAHPTDSNWFRKRLLQNSGDDTGADSAITFADGKTHILFDRDRLQQLDSHINPIARNYHVDRAAVISRKRCDRTCNIRCPHEELRAISCKERSPAAAFFFRQDVNLRIEFSVRLNRTGFSKHHPPLNFVDRKSG